MMIRTMEIVLAILVVQAVNTILFVRSRRSLLLNNIALRQQLVVYRRKHGTPALKSRDRLFWSMLSRIWSGWKSALVIVQPETVIRWQRRRFRDYWRKKSKPGRPAIPGQHSLHQADLRRPPADCGFRIGDCGLGDKCGRLVT